MVDKPDSKSKEKRLGFKGVHEGSYDKITRPDVELRVPGYFMQHWSQHLSTGAFALYLHLRHMCWYDAKNPQNSRDYCWPKQSTLAKRTGSSRASVQRHLKELEQNELISRSKTSYYNREMGKKLRGTDVYQVPYRVPLVPEHLADAAVIEFEEDFERAQQHPENQVVAPKHQNDALDQDAGRTPKPQNDALVSYPRPKHQNAVGTVASKVSSRSSTNNLNNVTNVISHASKRNRSEFKGDPRVSSLTDADVSRKERLTLSIGRTLDKIAGNQVDRDHPYQGFHRRVAYFMPEPEVNAALAAAQDKKDDQGIKNSASSYFTGYIKNRAKELGIKLDIEKPDETAVVRR